LSEQSDSALMIDAQRGPFAWHACRNGSATVRISFLPFGMADDASDHAPCMPLMKTARNYFVPGNASVGQISSTEYSRWFLEFKLGERL
jgi:hypothetical protein